jgi:hypothetical protein
VSNQTTYRHLAESQGVVRPFDILLRMPAESRRLIAQTLDCPLGSLTDPEAESWFIINRDLRGLQARTHHLGEQLSPFSRNNNWWEIVTRTAIRCGVKFYPGLKDEEVERLLFEHLADLFVQRLAEADIRAIDEIAEANPEFCQAIASLRLSRNATRAVLTAIALATTRTGESLRDGAAKASDWIRSWSRTHTWTFSVSAGLRLMRQKLAEIYAAWQSRGLAEPPVGNTSKVCAALAAIFLQDLVDRTLEEFDAIGG